MDGPVLGVRRFRFETSESMIRMAQSEGWPALPHPRPGTGTSRPRRPKNLPVYLTRIATLELGNR